MGLPRVFRSHARTMARGPLADKDAVPIIMDGTLHAVTPLGRLLRAIVQDCTIQVPLEDGTVGYVEQQVVTYHEEDLPRRPQKGDHVILDGRKIVIASTKRARIGLVDCQLSGEGTVFP